MEGLWLFFIMFKVKQLKIGWSSRIRKKKANTQPALPFPKKIKRKNRLKSLDDGLVFLV